VFIRFNRVKTAVKLVDQRLAEHPNELQSIWGKALLHACLGEKEEAQKLLRVLAEIMRTPVGQVNEATGEIRLRLGDLEPVLAWIESQLRSRAPGWQRAHSYVRFDFYFESLREAPRFQALLRETLPEGANSFASPARR
jgi:hypothetical protein